LIILPIGTVSMSALVGLLFVCTLGTDWMIEPHVLPHQRTNSSGEGSFNRVFAYA